MNKYSIKSKCRQVLATQQKLNASHPGQTAPAMLTHKDIAQKAYDIYAEKGCQQGQSNLNWLQAEQELKNQKNWLQAERHAKSQDQIENQVGD